MIFETFIPTPKPQDILNPEVQEQTRRISNEADFIFFLPYSGLRAFVKEGSIYSQTARHFNVWRTSELKQLGYLSALGSNLDDKYFTTFKHDRFDHMLVTAAINEAVLRGANLPEQQIRTGIVAGMIHDTAMPAGGDAMKLLEPDALSEEDHWKDVATEKDWQFLKDNNLCPEEIDRAIHNEGIVGDVLDKADRLSYTMKDLFNLGASARQPHRLITREWQMYHPYDPYYTDFDDIINEDPNVGDIYKEIGIDCPTGEVYFSDQDRLGRFLKLRAMMTQRVYSHPVNQGRDQMLVAIVRPLYGKQIDAQMLRTMTDKDLDLVVGKYYRDKDAGVDITDWRFGQWKASFRRFETKDEACQFESELRQGDQQLVIGQKRVKSFQTGEAYLVQTEHGRLPFGEVDQKTAADLSVISKQNVGHYVYFVDGSEDTPTNRLLRLISNEVPAAA